MMYNGLMCDFYGTIQNLPTCATYVCAAAVGVCIIGAGALVKENDVIPAGSLAVGVPAKIVRSLSPAQIASNRQNAEEYLQLMRQYAQNSR